MPDWKDDIDGILRKYTENEECDCQTPLEEWKNHREAIVNDCESAAIKICNVNNIIDSNDNIMAVSLNKMPEYVSNEYAIRTLYYDIIKTLNSDIQCEFVELLKIDALLVTATDENDFDFDVDSLAEHFKCIVMNIHATSLTFNSALERMQSNRIIELYEVDGELEVSNGND